MKPRTSPTIGDEEEARVQAEIAADPDSAELTDVQITAGGPAQAMLSPELLANLVRRGRPRSANAKVLVTLRLDPAVLDGYRSGGAGWQVRMGDVLAAGLSDERPPADAPQRRAAKSSAKSSTKSPPRRG